jgi:hypothetical protein
VTTREKQLLLYVVGELLKSGDLSPIGSREIIRIFRLEEQ